MCIYLSQVYDYFKNPPKNSPVNQMPIIINGFLLSYKLPAYDPKTPAKSVAAVINISRPSSLSRAKIAHEQHGSSAAEGGKDSGRLPGGRAAEITFSCI